METLEYEKELAETIETYLVLPKRVEKENHEMDLGPKLGVFLVKQGYISGISMKKGCSGFEYDNESKIISISENEISLDQWREFFFRKQSLLADKKTHSLYPMHPIYTPEADENEIDIYRFLHQVGHTYQHYLKDNESKKLDVDRNFYNTYILENTVDTPYANLLKFCSEKREQNFREGYPPKGLSIWGNIENYNQGENPESENIVRALKDANELFTMHLWHPQYFETYTNYLINSTEDFSKNKLVRITEDEAEDLANLVVTYSQQMKEEIGYGNN